MSDQPASPFTRAARAPGTPRAREVKEWVAAAAGTPEDATIVVSELACSEPGCPPYEVVMAVMLPGHAPVQRKLHKRLADLTREEVSRLWSGGDHEDEHHGELPPT